MAEFYNTQPGPPRVLIGNWVEERAFWESKKAYEEKLARGDIVYEPACQTLELQAGSLFMDQEFATTNGEYGDFKHEKKPVYGRPQMALTGVAETQLRQSRRNETCCLPDQTMSHDFLNTRDAPTQELSSTTRSDYARPELDPRPRMPIFEEYVKLYNTSRRKPAMD